MSHTAAPSPSIAIVEHAEAGHHSRKPRQTLLVTASAVGQKGQAAVSGQQAALSPRRTEARGVPRRPVSLTDRSTTITSSNGQHKDGQIKKTRTLKPAAEAQPGTKKSPTVVKGLKKLRRQASSILPRKFATLPQGMSLAAINQVQVHFDDWLARVDTLLDEVRLDLRTAPRSYLEQVVPDGRGRMKQRVKVLLARHRMLYKQQMFIRTLMMPLPDFKPGLQRILKGRETDIGQRGRTQQDWVVEFYTYQRPDGSSGCTDIDGWKALIDPCKPKRPFVPAVIAKRLQGGCAQGHFGMLDAHLRNGVPQPSLNGKHHATQTIAPVPIPDHTYLCVTVSGRSTKKGEDTEAAIKRLVTKAQRAKKLAKYEELTGSRGDKILDPKHNRTSSRRGHKANNLAFLTLDDALLREEMRVERQTEEEVLATANLDFEYVADCNAAFPHVDEVEAELVDDSGNGDSDEWYAVDDPCPEATAEYFRDEDAEEHVVTDHDAEWREWAAGAFVTA